MIREPRLQAATAEDWQLRPLKLPKHDIKLPDGRTLRKAIGYDLSKVAIDKATKNSFLASGGWRHEPSRFVVSAGIEDTGKWGPLLHVSMSYPDHDPTWAEIKMIRAYFFPPDMDCGMVLPRESDYVNFHKHCFHVWQFPQIWGIR